MKKLFTLLVSIFLMTGFLFGQGTDLANDIAYNGGWISGSNGGSGFGPWVINVPGGMPATGAAFIGTSDIATADKSWGLSSTEGITEAIRPFNLSPTTNDRISIKMDNENIVTPSGRVGFDLLNAAGDSLMQFYLEGTKMTYTINDAAGPRSTTVNKTFTGLLIEIEFNSPTTYILKITDIVPGTVTTLPPNNLINPTSNNQVITHFRLFNFQAGSDVFFNEVSHEVGVLPIKLESFDATKRTDAVELNWITKSEENNEGFYIERSINRTDFEQIHFEKGNGTTNEKVNYSFTDEHPLDGVNYYRLKQIDFDGAFEYSNMVSVDFKGQVSIKLFPNPSTDKLTITGDFSELVTLKIVDLNGKVLHQSEQFFAEQADINLDAIPSGSYFLQVISTKKQSTLSTMSFVKR